MITVVVAFAAVVAIVVVTLWSQRRLSRAVVEERRALEDTRVAQHKQAKAVTRRLAATERGAAKAIDQCRLLQDDARHLHAQISALMGDPRFQQFLRDTTRAED